MATVIKSELAGILGRSERTLTEWQKNGMPIKVDGIRGSANQYDTVECIEWMIQREVKRAMGDGPNTEAEGWHDPDQELARLRHHQANKVALEEQQLRGKLLDAEEVQLAMGKLDAEVRSAMLSMPSRMAPTLIKLKTVTAIRQALKTDVLGALDALASAPAADGCDDIEPPPGEA